MSNQSNLYEIHESSLASNSQFNNTNLFILRRMKYSFDFFEDDLILNNIEIELNVNKISFRDNVGKRQELEFSKLIEKEKDILVVNIKCDDKKKLGLCFNSEIDYNLFLQKVENLSKLDKKAEQNVQEEKIKSLIVDAFKSELKNSLDINLNCKDYLKLIINQYINERNSHMSNYHGPYSLICQSSGFGKTRSCLSLKDDFYIVYNCLRDKISQTGYPPRNNCAIYFTDNILNEKELTNFFKNYFNLFIDKLNNESLAESNYNEFKDEFSKNILDEINKLPRNGGQDYLLKKYTNSKPLIFVFDEASTMLPIVSSYSKGSIFFTLRNVITELDGNVFVLFLDTFSVLSQFMPAIYSDPSSRLSSANKICFHPIYLLPTLDAYADYDAIKNIQDTIKIENVCRFGRVLWGNLYDSYLKNRQKYQSENISNNFLRDLAIEKIIGGYSNPCNYKYTRDDYLAILSTRLGAFKINLFTTNQMLVAKNMAVCTFVDIVNNVFEIDYPSEPILADAGAFHLETLFESSINELQQCITSSIVDQSETGETIAKLILIKAMDDACTSSKTSAVQNLSKLKFIQVGEFLTHLYGKCSDVNECGKNLNGLWFCNNQKIEVKCSIKMILDQYDNTNTNHAQKLLNAYLNFNHFIKSYDCLIKELDFKRIIKRCAAVHCKHEEPGIDLVIPIAFNLNNFDELSAIFVQVKLHKEPEMVSYKKAFKNVRFRSLDIGDNLQPFLLLFMELGFPTKPENFIVKYLDSEIKDKISIKNIYENVSAPIKRFKSKKTPDLIPGEIEFRSNIFSMGISTGNFPSLSSEAVKNLINLTNTKPKEFFNGPDLPINQRLNEINKINREIRPKFRCLLRKSFF